MLRFVEFMNHEDGKEKGKKLKLNVLSFLLCILI